MVRILPLIPLMLWLGWSDQSSSRAVTQGDPFALIVLLLGLFSLVALMVVWARLIIRRCARSTQLRVSRYFSNGLIAARLLAITWFGVCLFALGFGNLVDAWLEPIADWHTRLPGLILSTWPIWMAWVGFWWAAYPLDRIAREQNLLHDIDAGRYITAPPSLRETLFANFRSQVLFVLAPVMAAVIFRDLAAITLRLFDLPMTGGREALVFAGSILIVYILSPELLIRVLDARPLAPSPLRSRLEAMAQRMKLKYHDILIWETGFNVGNAAVMGIVPRFRYILFTDLLLETLDDEQIEAVFAHEAGHIQHRHLLWYIVFIAIFMLASIGPAELAILSLQQVEAYLPLPVDLIVFILSAAIFFTLFGMLARLFEKQADVYAARAMQAVPTDEPIARPTQPVTHDGAAAFVGALVRVAEINHLPMYRPRRPRTLWAASAGHVFHVAMNFLHPSIPDRVDHLRDLAAHPTHTRAFDRHVLLVMLMLVASVMCLAAWVGVLYLRSIAML